jgi:hypothetical protein
LGEGEVTDQRSDTDRISDLLKASTVRSHQRGKELPEVEVAALFVNERDGPQFFVGERGRAQPLYFTPAREGQEPVAWMAPAEGRIITQDRSLYRDDVEWVPLYLAR